MLRILPLLLVPFLTGCVCVTNYAPSECQPCGLRLHVATTRPVGEVLTRAECEKLCAPAWCGETPSDGGVGCRLIAETELFCDAVGPDCKMPPPVGCGPATCAGCCRTDGHCVQDRGPCGGRSCSECPPDARCNATNCARLEACGARLPAMPRWSSCEGVDGGFQRPSDAAEDCVKACARSDAGPELSCVGALATCDDAGVDVGAQCFGDGGAPSSCTDSCAETRLRCEAACPLDSSETCASCARACGVSFATCVGDCP